MLSLAFVVIASDKHAVCTNGYSIVTNDITVKSLVVVVLQCMPGKLKG